VAELAPQPLSGIVGFWHEREDDARGRLFFNDRRLLRAALLYADQVEIPSLTLHALCGAVFKDHVGADDIRERASDEFRWARWPAVYAVCHRFLGVGPGPVDLRPDEEQMAGEVVAELRLAADAGALVVPALTPDALERAVLADDDPAKTRFLRAPAAESAETPATSRASWETMLARSLLGQLEAFPNASMDVVLDVRNRLQGPRVRFRAALASVANDLSESDRDVKPAVAVEDLRVRIIDPALQEIREELEALGARRTLMRAASDRITVATSAASFAIAASGLPALDELTHVALVAPFVAAAAKELDFRATLRKEVRANPFWWLREADERFRSQ
jgi:hypothetical protein